MSSTIEYIIKRTGESVPFDKARIFRAIEKAFLSTNASDPLAVSELTQAVLERIDTSTGIAHVEDVQDTTELVLMDNGYTSIAKSFILYREQHKRAREEKILKAISDKQLSVTHSDGTTSVYNPHDTKSVLNKIGINLNHIDPHLLLDTVNRNVYPRIPACEVEILILNAARDNIERHYDYDTLSARICLNQLYDQCLGTGFNTPDLEGLYQSKFTQYIETGIAETMLDPRLADFDLETLGAAIVSQNDTLFQYLGIQILSDRYLLRNRSKDKFIYELPQWFWMRVAMGLSLQETDREARAIEFYTVLSNMELVSSTPTLFNSGTRHSQMSSCYLNTVDDSLTHIFKVYSDNAQLSKWAGGIGTDWSNIRATGSDIQGTNGESQGVIPFIKIFNDIALAVNQGGKRKGAMCAYMEVWHADFEQFLELKKNTGDERRRAHDINTASWIPDLFMKRLQNNEPWTFFCPSEVPDLHDLYGQAFEQRYCEYETQNLSSARQISAGDLWRKIITMLYETGHPWITFKDPINVRSPQDHVGVVHSSNLCTEITLNTSIDETAVCNLASLNLSKFITKSGELDHKKLRSIIKIGIRMLDNVIDNNYYPTEEAKTANLCHRAIGLGMMGYQDALYQLNIAFDSQAAVEFADQSMESIAYYAILSSSMLAKERGHYSSYSGSKWDRNIFPQDTLALLEAERGEPLSLNPSSQLDWSEVRNHVQAYGMRNSNVMAIAPTATIANITGVYPCTEPAYKNMYMKENLSGSFVIINQYLINRLQALGLWNTGLLNTLKLHNGSIQSIDEIPSEIKAVFKEVFEVDTHWLIEAAARRGKWIDQSASTNIFTATTSGRVLGDIYQKAWKMGLKTTYYLRTLAASQVEKSGVEAVEACSITDPSCEVCQ
ncbi:ribonucleoside-diphosphate reductase subunit alpha [bacterium]|nr:ribonucleoside-diphosphate reductase subunit alpha [bacterium]|tara:strand:- start:62 stop:2740 length:2679 start_codon:yes stop_codon:yes gene_type:complete